MLSIAKTGEIRTYESDGEVQAATGIVTYIQKHMLLERVVYEDLILCHHMDCEWAFQKARGLSWPVGIPHKELAVPARVVTTYDRKLIDLFSCYRCCGARVTDHKLWDTIAAWLRKRGKQTVKVGTWLLYFKKKCPVPYALVDKEGLRYWLANSHPSETVRVANFKAEFAEELLEYVESDSEVGEAGGGEVALQTPTMPFWDMKTEDGSAVFTQLRTSDGYINATKMCQSAGREWKTYWRSDATKAFYEVL